MPKKKPAPAVAAESVPYSASQRDPKEVEAGRALGKATAPRRIYDICAKHLSKESQEVFLVLPLDLRGQLCARPVEVARGQRDRVGVDTSDIFRPVIVHNAKGFVVVHVHPSGHAKPSPADKRLTVMLFEATPKALGGDVRFVDHLIIASSAERGEYYSFREHMTVRGGTCHFSRSARVHVVRSRPPAAPSP